MKKTTYVQPTAWVSLVDEKDLIATSYGHATSGEGDWVEWNDGQGDIFV